MIDQEFREPRSASAILTSFTHQRVFEKDNDVARGVGVSMHRLYSKSQDFQSSQLDASVAHEHVRLLLLLDESRFPISDGYTQKQESPFLAWNWIPVLTETLMVDYVVDLMRTLESDVKEMATALVIMQVFVVRHPILFSSQTAHLLILIFFVLGHKIVQECILKTGDIVLRCKEFMPLLDPDHIITIEFELFSLINYTIPNGEIYQKYLEALYSVANEEVPVRKRLKAPCILPEEPFRLES